MNYIGSKYSLLEFIDYSVRLLVGNDLSGLRFCDLFAGTGIVGRHFKSRGCSVTANDMEYYSYVLNRNYIGNCTEIDGKDSLIARLNELPGKEGFIYNQYCLGGGNGRQYFSDSNGLKIDAVRTAIEEWRLSGEITDDAYFFLLCSLIESADKVANTASVYGAFLKHLKRSAQKEIIISPADLIRSCGEHSVYQEDANSLIRKISGEILYLDPPYNSRQYGANYHLLNTIADYTPFTPKGKTGLRDYRKSDYCSKRTVAATFEELVKLSRFKYIILSYNNEGLMPPDVIARIMSKYGKYQVFNREYHRFKADSEENRQHSADSTIEYLHVLTK